MKPKLTAPVRKKKLALPNPPEDRQQEMLDTAARIFCDRGYQNVTLEEIAEAMGTTREVLHRYAATTEEIVVAIGAIANARLHAAIADAVREKTGREEIIAFFRQYLEIIHDCSVACFILVDHRQLSPGESKKTRLRLRDFLLAIQSMLERGVADGSIRPCPAPTVSRTLYSAFNGTLFTFRPGERQNWPKLADSILDTFLKGLRPISNDGKKL